MIVTMSLTSLPGSPSALLIPQINRRHHLPQTAERFHGDFYLVTGVYPAIPFQPAAPWDSAHAYYGTGHWRENAPQILYHFLRPSDVR